METIKYKGFIGSVNVSVKDNCIYGKILFINDLVTYEADSIDQLKAEFKAAVDDYVETCRELGIEPLKSLSGSFNVRIGPNLHQKLTMQAIGEEKTLNTLVIEAVKQYLHTNELEQ